MSLAAPALAADPCASLASYRPAVATEIHSPEPALRNDIPYSTIERVQGASRATLLGVTEIARDAEHRFETDSRAAPDGHGVCVALRRIDLRIVHTTLRISIAEHVRPGSCTYDVTMRHERDHVSYERGALRKALKEIEKEIARPHGYVHGVDEAAALAAIETRATRWMNKALKRAVKLAKRGHAYLDIPSNIRGSLAKCPRWRRR